MSTTILKRETGVSSLDPTVIDKYQALPFPSDKILAEYVWVDAVGNTRSKTRTLEASKVNTMCVLLVGEPRRVLTSHTLTILFCRKGESVEKLPKWNFDGVSSILVVVVGIQIDAHS